MKGHSAIFLVAVLISVGTSLGLAQGFVNLNFEQSVIVTSSPSGYGFDLGTANVPGWTEYYGSGDVNYSGGATLIYNSQPLDSPGVSLEDTNYWTPAIQRKYSILMYGGSTAYAQQYGATTNGASIGQTGQIPLTAQSITYWGAHFNYVQNGFQVTFKGQPLSFITISNAANYTIYGADVSAFVGQTGELLFTAPWQSYGMLDNIQFSPSSVPEPSEFALVAIGTLLFGFRRWNDPKK